MTHEKKFPVFVRETYEAEIAKIAAFNFESCGRRQGLKNTRKSPFSMNKKFSIHFSKKKLLEEKYVYIHLLRYLSKFGEHRFINKKKTKKKVSQKDGSF